MTASIASKIRLEPCSEQLNFIASEIKSNLSRKDRQGMQFLNYQLLCSAFECELKDLVPCFVERKLLRRSEMERAVSMAM